MCCCCSSLWGRQDGWRESRWMVGRLDLRPCAGSRAKYRWARKICKIPEFRQPFLGPFIGTLLLCTRYTRRSLCSGFYEFPPGTKKLANNTDTDQLAGCYVEPLPYVSFPRSPASHRQTPPHQQPRRTSGSQHASCFGLTEPLSVGSEHRIRFETTAKFIVFASDE